MCCTPLRDIAGKKIEKNKNLTIEAPNDAMWAGRLSDTCAGIFLKWNYTAGFGAFGGYSISGKIKTKNGADYEEKIKFGNGIDDLKPFDVGLNLLIGYRLPGRVFFSLNTTSSLNNISNDDIISSATHIWE